MPDDINLEELSDDQLAAAQELLRARSDNQGGNSPFDTGPRRSVEREFSNANEKRQDLERRFNESTRGSAVRHSPLGNPEAPSVQELIQYSKDLLGTRGAAALAKTSAKPAVREAFAKMRPETW